MRSAAAGAAAILRGAGAGVVRVGSGRGVARGALALADQGVVSGASFLTALVVGRVTSPAELGRYAVALTVVLLLMEVQNSLIGTPYTVRRPRLKAGRLARYTGNVTLVQAGIAGIAAVVLLPVGILMVPSAAVLVAMLAAALVPVLVREHIRRLAFAGFELSSALRVDLLVATLQFGAIASLAMAGRLNATTALAAIGAAAAAGAGWWWIAARPPLRLSPAAARRALPSVWRAGRWPLASGLAWAAGLYAYPWLLAAVQGSGAAGIWAAGMGLASLANPALLGIGNYLAPETAHVLAAGGPRRLGVMVRRSCGLLTAIMLPLIGVAALAGDRLVAVVYGSAFAGTGSLVCLLSIHLWMTAVAFPISRALFALERADLELRANLAGLVVLAVGGFWFVAGYGPQGGAAGLALGGAVANLARARSLRRLVREREA